MSKNVFIVIGMARSGTSAIARGLKAIGIDLGEKLTPASAKWNPKGFFEDNDIVYKINRAVLYTLDYAWTGINMVPRQNFAREDLRHLKEMATDLLKKRIANTNYWGFKDPRTVKILPFWQEIFANLELKENYIIALRNPLASAHSYQRVTDTDIEVGLLLWLLHLISAIDETEGKKRIMVSYEAMLADPRGQLARIQKQLEIPTLGEASEIDQYANEFLDKKLQHFELSEEDLKSHAAMTVVPLCMKLYQLFIRLARDEMTFEGEIFKTEWQQVKSEFEKIYPIYSYMDVLLKKNKKMERVLRSIYRSVPWKLLYPLRIIDDALRSVRRKAREKRRLVSQNG